MYEYIGGTSTDQACSGPSTCGICKYEYISYFQTESYQTRAIIVGWQKKTNEKWTQKIATMVPHHTIPSRHRWPCQCPRRRRRPPCRPPPPPKGAPRKLPRRTQPTPHTFSHACIRDKHTDTKRHAHISSYVSNPSTRALVSTSSRHTRETRRKDARIGAWTRSSENGAEIKRASNREGTALERRGHGVNLELNTAKQGAAQYTGL